MDVWRNVWRQLEDHGTKAPSDRERSEWLRELMPVGYELAHVNAIIREYQEEYTKANHVVIRGFSNQKINLKGEFSEAWNDLRKRSIDGKRNLDKE